MPRQEIDTTEKISPDAEYITNEADYTRFLDRLYSEEGIDLAQYKQNQMRRRLNMTIRQAGQESYCGFLDYAQENADVYRRFIDRITINVSEFFRDPEKFEILEQRYLLPLLKRNPVLTIWSAGCSTGEEVYTLALLLKKHAAGAGARILGWDFDSQALERAAEGIYGAESLKNVPRELLARYFIELDGGRFQVQPELKERIVLERHNMLEDPFPAGVDLILCRNVVIYFSEQSKRQLFVRFGKALAATGVLMTGASERILNLREAGLRFAEPLFYVREESGWPSRERRARPRPS